MTNLKEGWVPTGFSTCVGQSYLTLCAMGPQRSSEPFGNRFQMPHLILHNQRYVIQSPPFFCLSTCANAHLYFFLFVCCNREIWNWWSSYFLAHTRYAILRARKKKQSLKNLPITYCASYIIIIIISSGAKISRQEWEWCGISVEKDFSSGILIPVIWIFSNLHNSDLWINYIRKYIVAVSLLSFFFQSRKKKIKG